MYTGFPNTPFRFALLIPLIIFLFGDDLTAISEVWRNPASIVAVLAVFLVVSLRVVQIRSPLRDLISKADVNLKYGTVVLGMSFLLSVAVSYAFPLRLLSWISILIFIISYSLLVFGMAFTRVFAWLILPFVVLVGLPPVASVAVIVPMLIMIQRNVSKTESRTCQISHDSLTRGSFCSYCGRQGLLAEKVLDTRRNRSSAGVLARSLVFITLLSLLFSSVYLPVSVQDEGDVKIGRFTARGVVSTDIFRGLSEPGYSSSILRFNNSTNEPLSEFSPESSSTLPLRQAFAQIRTFSFEDDDDNGTLLLITMTSRIPYINSNGNLAEERSEIFILSSAPENENSSSVPAVTIAEEIDRRLAFQGKITSTIYTLSLILGKSMNLLFAVLGPVAILTVVTVGTRSDKRREHRLNQVLALPKDSQTVGLVAISKGGTGETIHSEAKKAGHKAGAEDLVKELEQLENLSILTKKFEIEKSKLIQIWTPL